MTFGAVILFDVVATLGGGVFTTLGLRAVTLGAGGGGAFDTLGLGATPLGAGVQVLTVGCEPVRTVGHSGVCHPAKMAVKS